MSILSEIRALHWADWAMILFFASRFYTSIFTLLMGSKGIYVSMGVLFVIYFMAMIYEWKNHGSRYLSIFIIFVFSITLVALVTMTFNQEAKDWMLSFDKGIITRIFDVRKSVFAAFVLLLVREKGRILKNLTISSFLSFFYLMTQAMLYIVNGSWEYYYVLEDTRSAALSYNLSFGYEMIFVSIVFFAVAISERRFFYWIAGGISFALAFLLGSRGSVLPILTFFVLFLLSLLWSNREKINWKKMFYAFMITVFIGAALLLAARMSLQEGESFSTGIRNIDMLISNNFADDNGRTKIWALSMEGITAKFPLGYGMYGDRPFVGQRFSWGYSHNIVLEMIVSFGAAGLLIILGLLYLGMKFFFGKAYDGYRIILLVFIAMNSKLLISDSFWFYDYFWGMLALFVIIHMVNRHDHRVFQFEEADSRSIRTHSAPLIVISVLLIAVNISIAFMVIRDEISNQKYSPVRFEKPSAVIVLQDMDSQAFKLGIQEVRERGGTPSIFVDMDKLSSQDVLDLERGNHADIHISLGNRSLGTMQSESIDSYVRDSIAAIRSLQGKEHLALSTLNSHVFPETLSDITEYSDAFLLKSLRFGSYYYKTLYQSDLNKLNAMDASINNRNYISRMEYVKDQIDLTVENEGLIIIYFRNIRVSPIYIGEERTYTKYDFYKEVLDYLQMHDFQLFSMTELLEQAHIPEDKRTLKNLIIDSEFYQKLR